MPEFEIELDSAALCWSPDVGEVYVTDGGETFRVVGATINLQCEDGYIYSVDVSSWRDEIEDMVSAQFPFCHPLLPEDAVCWYDDGFWTIQVGDLTVEHYGTFTDAVQKVNEALS